MAPFSDWLKENWLSVQTVGIVGTLFLSAIGQFFTAISIRRDTRARRTTDLLSLAKQHREIWSQLSKPELTRILKSEVDLIASPATIAEEEFLNGVFVHNYTSWLLEKQGASGLVPLRALKADIRGFYTLPLPNYVWRETSKKRDPKFVRFVNKCVGVRKI